MEPTLPAWLRKIDHNLWETTQPLYFETDRGEVIIPAGFTTDLFTVVAGEDNWLQYPDFAKASILHDYLIVRLKEGKPVPGFDKRKHCDDAFYAEMITQAALIFAYIEPAIGKRDAIDVLLKLIKTADRYYYGVRAFGWLWQLFN